MLGSELNNNLLPEFFDMVKGWNMNINTERTKLMWSLAVSHILSRPCESKDKYLETCLSLQTFRSPQVPNDSIQKGVDSNSSVTGWTKFPGCVYWPKREEDDTEHRKKFSWWIRDIKSSRAQCYQSIIPTNVCSLEIENAMLRIRFGSSFVTAAEWNKNFCNYSATAAHVTFASDTLFGNNYRPLSN